jgi:hypothetical protein
VVVTALVLTSLASPAEATAPLSPYPDAPEGVVAAFAAAANAKDRAAAERLVDAYGPGQSPMVFLNGGPYQLTEVECDLISERSRACSFYLSEPASDLLVRKVGGRWRVAGQFSGPFASSGFPPECLQENAPVRVRADRTAWLRGYQSAVNTSTTGRVRRNESGTVCVPQDPLQTQSAEWLQARFGGEIGWIRKDNVRQVGTGRERSREASVRDFVGSWSQHMGTITIRRNGKGLVECRDCLGIRPSSDPYGMSLIRFRITKAGRTTAKARVTASDDRRIRRGQTLSLRLKAPGILVGGLDGPSETAFCDRLHYGECGA